jgi:hypothetical protein
MSGKKMKLPTGVGSVIQLDSFLMRTRWENWVSDACFTLTDEQIADEIARGYVPVVIFDAGTEGDI